MLYSIRTDLAHMRLPEKAHLAGFLADRLTNHHGVLIEGPEILDLLETYLKKHEVKL